MYKNALVGIMDADAMAARTRKERVSRCGRSREVVAVEVVLGAAGRMCGVEIQHHARLTAQLLPFEARKQCF